MCVNILQCHICCLFLPGMMLGIHELLNRYQLKLNLTFEVSKGGKEEVFFQVISSEAERAQILGFIKDEIS